MFFMVGDFTSELHCKLLSLYNTKGCWNFTLLNHMKCGIDVLGLTIEFLCHLWINKSLFAVFLCFLCMQMSYVFHNLNKREK